ncbi:cytochrome P450 monooxygenase CYP63 [Pholiota conissans]|uniref:Cytochrome P450 monooxygenase CYP63 n=1 Tax=Pholiota conissans TaxID=109636 RepID=A0A9P5ZBZ4_9AGAR|nr:cytochrome P450 monooxygenase CYP63 [Pholiota conissans]
MNPSNYRARLLRDIFQDWVVPPFCLRFALSMLGYELGYLTIPMHIIFIMLWATVKSAITAAKRAREARSLNARPIPCAVGKLPGNIDILIKMMVAFKTSYVLDVYLQLFEEYQCTTLNLRLLWRDNIISMDQEHTKFILATGFQWFWRGRSQKERMELFLGEGIFNRDDEIWKMHRSTARPFFARERIEDFEVFERHCTHTLAILSSFSASNTPCEAQDLYGRFSLDAASDFLFGKNLETLSASLPVAGKTAMGPKGSATEDPWGSFAQAFEMAQINITSRARLGSIWPLFEFFKDKNEEHCKVIKHWLDPLVTRALENKAAMGKVGISSPVAEKNFLQHLADSTNDPVQIRDQLLSMLLASRDTTACVLTYITYFLAIHPHITTKLRAEVLQTVGSTAAPTFEQLRHMKYMRAVINETLRLFPPVPLNVRETRSAPCALPPPDRTYSESADPRPLYMPAETTIIYLPLLTQRNSALWGEDADEFDPERWIDPARVAKFVAHPAMYTPFSAGPRICLGQNYAYNETSYFLVRLLQQFDRFTLAPEVQPEGSLPPAVWRNRKGRQAYEKIWPSAAMTLYVKGGLWVRYHKARA